MTLRHRRVCPASRHLQKPASHDSDRLRGAIGGRWNSGMNARIDTKVEDHRRRESYYPQFTKATCAVQQWCGLRRARQRARTSAAYRPSISLNRRGTRAARVEPPTWPVTENHRGILTMKTRVIGVLHRTDGGPSTHQASPGDTITVFSPAGSRLVCMAITAVELR